MACIYLVVVVANAGRAGSGNEIVVNNVVAEDTSGIGDGICGLVVIHYVVDVLRVGLGKWLAVMPAHPEVAVVGRLVAFDMCAELLADGKGDD